jgi:hypothetical protein
MSLFARSALAVCSFTAVFAASALASAAVDSSDPPSGSTDAQDGTHAGAHEIGSTPGPLVFAPPVEADRAAMPRPPRRDSKPFVVARDFGLAVPVGHFTESAEAMYGPLVRLGFHVNDSFELGVRAGYQRGFEREIAGIKTSLSMGLINASVRWFVLGDRSGPYTGAEVGVNVFRQKLTPRTSIFDIDADATWARPGANVGIGFVWSRSFPLDLRAQVAAVDLLAKGGPANALALGVTAGYSIFF